MFHCFRHVVIDEKKLPTYNHLKINLQLHVFDMPLLMRKNFLYPFHILNHFNFLEVFWFFVVSSE